MSDINKISNSDFMIEKIKERPINRRKLMRRTFITASMAVIFGLIACFTILLLEPVLSNWLYPEEEAQVVVFPEDEEEMEPEDMLEENLPDSEPAATPMPQQTFSPEQDEKLVEKVLGSEKLEEKMLASVKLDKNHYVELYGELADFVAELSKYMVVVTSVKENSNWLESYEKTSDGSGVVIANNGVQLLVLTDAASNRKVDAIQVTFSNGRTVEAEVLSRHTEMNLAVLGVDLELLGTAEEAAAIPVAVLGSSKASKLLGSPVIAMGNPMGVTGSMGYGFITAQARETTMVDSNYDILVTDIYGSENAQGVLFNMQGQVIGIVAPTKVNQDLTHMVTAYGVSDMKQMITVLSAGEAPPYLGIEIISVTQEANEESGIPLGTYVTDVLINSPAMVAGIQKGDIIVGIDEAVVEDYSDLRRGLYKAGAGRNINLKIMRQSQESYKEMSIDVTLAGAN